jgi:hypothetical protein
MPQTTTNPRPEDAAARAAIRELKRLASEASRRFDQNSLIATTSSLTAMSTVLDPLLGYLQKSWVESEVGATNGAPCAEADDEPVGLYL